MCDVQPDIRKKVCRVVRMLTFGERERGFKSRLGDEFLFRGEAPYAVGRMSRVVIVVVVASCIALHIDKKKKKRCHSIYTE